MKTVLLYLFEYIKINALFSYFVIFLFILSLVKYLKLPRFTVKVSLIAIIVIGLLLRVSWLVYSGHEPRMKWNLTSIQEIDLINIHAAELTKGIWFHDANGIPSGRRPIGYPMFLGLLYKIFGLNIEVAWLSSLCLFMATVILLFLMGRTLFSDRIGIMAALIFSLYPISIYSVKMTVDEHLFLPLWYLGLFLLFREIKGRSLPYNWFWYGIIFGYATMTRTHTIFMPIVAGIALFLTYRSWSRAVAGALLILLTMQVINLPWLIRNYRAWRVPVLYTATGNFLYSRVNSFATPEGDGRIPRRGEPGFSEELEHAIVLDNQGLVHKISNREMFRWIIQHPRDFLVLGTARLLSFMNWNRKSGVWPIWFQFYEGSFDPKRPISKPVKAFLEELAFSFYYTVLFCSIFSTVLIGYRWKTLSPTTKICISILGVCFLFWFLEHMVIFADRKYRYPLEPLMILIGCYFIKYLVEEFRWEHFLNKLCFLYGRIPELFPHHTKK